MYKVYKTKGDKYLIFGDLRISRKLFPTAGNQEVFEYEIETVFLDEKGKIDTTGWLSASTVEKDIEEENFGQCIGCTENINEARTGIEVHLCFIKQESSTKKKSKKD